MNEELKKRLEEIENEILYLKSKQNRNEQEELKKARQEDIIRTYAAPFDKAVMYMNAITLAGYAGCFALWSTIQENLSRDRNAWIAIFLGISLSTFVLYEVYKMTSWTIKMRKIHDLVFSSSSLAEFTRKRDAISRAESLIILSKVPVWEIALAITTISGMTAAIIIFWNYVTVVLS